MSGNLKRRKIFAQSQSISPNLDINYKGKTRSFTVEKPSKHYLNQLAKINVTSIKICYHHVSLIQYTENGETFLWYSSKKCITSIQEWKDIRQTQAEGHAIKQLVGTL